MYKLDGFTWERSIIVLAIHKLDFWMKISHKHYKCRVTFLIDETLQMFQLFFPVDVSVDGRPICVTLCDTAGQDALDPLRQLCYPDSDVFLLCFSVVQPESFRSVAAKWEPEIAKLRRAALLLVGTQSDLRTDRATVLKLQVRAEGATVFWGKNSGNFDVCLFCFQNEGEKPVPVSAAWDFARKIGAKYIETSSHKKVSFLKFHIVNNNNILLFFSRRRGGDLLRSNSSLFTRTSYTLRRNYAVLNS